MGYWEPPFQGLVNLNRGCDWGKLVPSSQNQNSSLVKRQNDNTSPGDWPRKISPTREVNLDTLSSDSSEEEIRDSGRSFQSLIVWGKKLYVTQ